MTEKAIIRIGDKTSHGGTVLEGHQMLVVHGKPAAGVGHRVSCPKCSGSPVIVEGSVIATMMGVRIAVEGMKTSCGATLIASQITDTISVDEGGDTGGSSPSSGGAAPTAASAASAGAAAQVEASAPDGGEGPFDDHYVLVDAETGEALANVEYAIVRGSGAVEHGVTDGSGKTHLLAATAEAEDIDIYV